LASQSIVAKALNKSAKKIIFLNHSTRKIYLNSKFPSQNDVKNYQHILYFSTGFATPVIFFSVKSTFLFSYDFYSFFSSRRSFL